MSTSSETKTPPLFQLSGLFDPEKVNYSALREVIYGDKFPKNWLELGLEVNPLTNDDKEAIILSLFQDEVSPGIKFTRGFFVSIISAPVIFSLICKKIDELRPINSPQEFFYNVVMANELFEMFLAALSSNYRGRQSGSERGLNFDCSVNPSS